MFHGVQALAENLEDLDIFQVYQIINIPRFLEILVGLCVSPYCALHHQMERLHIVSRGKVKRPDLYWQLARRWIHLCCFITGAMSSVTGVCFGNDTGPA